VSDVYFYCLCQVDVVNGGDYVLIGCVCVCSYYKYLELYYIKPIRTLLTLGKKL